MKASSVTLALGLFFSTLSALADSSSRSCDGTWSYDINPASTDQYACKRDGQVVAPFKSCNDDNICENHDAIIAKCKEGCTPPPPPPSPPPPSNPEQCSLTLDTISFPGQSQKMEWGVSPPGPKGMCSSNGGGGQPVAAAVDTSSSVAECESFCGGQGHEVSCQYAAGTAAYTPFCYACPAGTSVLMGGNPVPQGKGNYYVGNCNANPPAPPHPSDPGPSGDTLTFNFAVGFSFAKGTECIAKTAVVKAASVSLASGSTGPVSSVEEYCHLLYPLGEGQTLDLKPVLSANVAFSSEEECVEKITAVEANSVSLKKVENGNLEDVGEPGAFCGALFPPRPQSNANCSPVSEPDYVSRCGVKGTICAMSVSGTEVTFQAPIFGPSPWDSIDFGDGTSGSQFNSDLTHWTTCENHIYAAKGTYSACLALHGNRTKYCTTVTVP